MHCHLIVSRKDQSNKKKISPLTNHKNTKKGTVKGGFNRTILFQQVERGFDTLFNYNRPLTETFEYYNTKNNGTIQKQLKMQERELQQAKILSTGEKEKTIQQSTEKEQIKTELEKPKNKHKGFRI